MVDFMNSVAPNLRNRAMNESDESGDDEDEEDEPNAVNWGRKKKTYYSGDTADLEIGQDIEDGLEEQEAAKELYEQKMKRMNASDFGMDDDEEVMAQGKKPKTKDAVARELEALAGQEEVEQVAKSVAHLSAAAKLDLLTAQAPELLVLVKELRERVDELQNRIQPVRVLAKKLQEMGKVDDDLVDYLEMKAELLLAYCLNVTFYLYMKALGKPVRSHPVMRQLLRCRYAMEKVYALDAKLKAQVDRLAKLATDSESLASSMLKPNLAALLDDDDEQAVSDEEEEAVAAKGLYRAPRLTSTPYPEDGAKESAKDPARAARQRKKLQTSELFETLQEEFGSAPEEVASGGIANVSADLKRLEQEEAERRAFEEDRFIRMTLTKKEKQSNKRRAAEALRVDNFEDIGSIDDLEHLNELSANTKQSKRPMGGEDASKALERAVRELGSDTRSRRAAPMDMDMEDNDAQVPVDSEDDGENLFDDFSAKKKAFAAKKKEHYSAEPRYAGRQEVVAEGDKRAASYEIMKNRGLTPHRKKANRNPRVKKREMYDKALIRRKGAVREAGGREDVGYQGEMTGIKANLSHSRKMA